MRKGEVGEKVEKRDGDKKKKKSEREKEVDFAS